MSWIELRITGADPTARDAIVATLVHAGAGGVQEIGTDLLTYVPAGTSLDTLSVAIHAASASARIHHASVADIDWTAQWPARVGVQRIGCIAIAPPWRASEIEDTPIPIIIEPALAFGTGAHETTRSVLHLMQTIMHPGAIVADLGAGSAVLAIAAAKLGAALVAAIELDPHAIPNAEANIAHNAVADRVTVIEGDAAVLLPFIAPVDVIVANIISSVLIDLAPVMRAALAPSGRTILSGMLVSEREMMLHALERSGWTLASTQAEHTEGDWWSCVIVPR